MNVLSLFDGKYKITSDGDVISTVGKEKKLRGKVGKSGYRTVLLTVEGKRYYKLVHRLVAEAFIPNPNNYRTVNHIDGDKLNNNLNNLEWASDSQNLRHARDLGLLNTKLTKELADEIRNEKGTNRALAKKYNISKTLVGQIKVGKRWA